MPYSVGSAGHSPSAHEDFRIHAEPNLKSWQEGIPACHRSASSAVDKPSLSGTACLASPHSGKIFVFSNKAIFPPSLSLLAEAFGANQLWHTMNPSVILLVPVYN